ncbi:unnamed protein product [Ectocarpus sp. 12 AP-2014]
MRRILESWSAAVLAISSNSRHWVAVSCDDDLAPGRWLSSRTRYSRSALRKTDRGLVDGHQLQLEHNAMAWKEEDPAILSSGKTTYSVIVVERLHHTSNLIRDKERVRAFEGGNTTVVSMQFADTLPRAYDDSAPPFFVGHPAEGVDKRVRLVYLKEFWNSINENQASHLQASCKDRTETTVLIISDETCELPELPPGLPPSCRANVVRVFPFNKPRTDGLPRNAFLPLGPRDTFPFVSEDRRPLASRRSLLFNLQQVRPDTSDRRAELVNIASQYESDNPDLECATNRPHINPKEWQDLVLDSKFTICPAGRNPGTFRLWEALEGGSIPIVSKLDFTQPALGALSTQTCGDGDVAWNIVAASPFVEAVSVNDWHELPALLDRLRQEPDDYINKLQEDCVAWHASAMTQAYTSVLNFGEGHDLFPQDGPLFGSV